MPKYTKHYYRKQGRRYVVVSHYKFPSSPCDGLFLVQRDGRSFDLCLRLHDVPCDLDVRAFAACVTQQPRLFEAVRAWRQKPISDSDVVSSILGVLAEACTAPSIELAACPACGVLLKTAHKTPKGSA